MARKKKYIGKPKVKPKKRKVTNKTKKKTATKKQSFKSPALKGLLAAIGVATIIEGANLITNMINNLPTYQIANVLDLEDDEFDNAVPLYQDGELIATIEADQPVVITDKSDDNSTYTITALQDDGTLITAEIPSDYLDFESLIKIKANDERIKYSYEVTADDGVRVRSDTTLDDSNIIGAVFTGDYVMGGDRIISKDNDFMWIPVYYTDENGKICEAYIAQDFLKMLDKIELVEQTVNEKSMVVNTNIDNGVDLHLRSDPEITDNIIANIPNGTVITTTDSPDTVSTGYKWKKIQYINENGETLEGWVISNYLDECELVKFKIDTSRDGKVNLNVRKEPRFESEKVASIEHGTVIEIPKEAYEHPIRNEQDKLDWVRIDLKDGTHGYVSSKYLQIEKEKEKETIKEDEEEYPDDGSVISKKELESMIDKFSVRPNGNVVGIDVSDLAGTTPDQLRKMLTNDSAIPDYVYRADGTFDSEDVSGKIDFVIMRIGARGWGEAGNMVDYDSYYVGLASVLEELGVPYGFYFYSTALTEEEADYEIRYCEECLSAVKDRKHNLIPFVLNIETQSGSRLEYSDNSDIAVYWANQAEKSLGKVMLYGPGRNYKIDGSDNTREEILDPEVINKGVHSGPPKLWLASLRNPNGEGVQGPISDASARQKMNVVMTQTILDCNNFDDDNNPLYKCDINIIQRDEFEKMLKERRNEILKQHSAIGSIKPPIELTSSHEKDNPNENEI